jgi:hypothetical protein
MHQQLSCDYTEYSSLQSTFNRQPALRCPPGSTQVVLFYDVVVVKKVAVLEGERMQVQHINTPLHTPLVITMS